MILLLTATEREMAPLLERKDFQSLYRAGQGYLEFLVTGVGPVATAICLTRWLCERRLPAGSLVLQFGIGGAYPQPVGNTPEVLDLCLAEEEVLADFGVADGDRMEYFSQELGGALVQDFSRKHVQQVYRMLVGLGKPVHVGRFLTVQAVSGTRERGDFLRQEWGGLCENMEGAAAAKVCNDFALPFVELRSVSNLVEKRNSNLWKIDEACLAVASVIPYIINELRENKLC